MRLNLEDYFLISLFLGFVIILGYVIFNAEARWDDCENRGGVVLKTSKGYLCAKVEKV